MTIVQYVIITMILFFNIVEAVEIDISSSSMKVIDSQTIKVKAIQTLGDTYSAEWRWNPEQNTWVLNNYNIQSWKIHANMPTGGNWGATAVWNNILYVIGGADRSSSVEAYNSISNQWIVKNDYPVGFLVRAITVGDNIYVIGDKGEFWKYFPFNDTWLILPNTPTPKWISELAEVSGKIYAFGGRTPSSSNTPVFNTVWEYNPVTGIWITKAPMPTARYGSATAVINNKIYVFGGNYGNSAAEVYTPATDSWEVISDIPFPSVGWDIAASSGNNIVMVIAGDLSDQGKTIIYNPITDTYQLGEQISILRHNYIMGDSINERVMVVGGSAELAKNKLESYLPSNTIAIRSTPIKRNTSIVNIKQAQLYFQKHEKKEKALLRE